MWGQWIGNINGTNRGVVTLNIDADSPGEGVLLVHDDNPNLRFAADVSLSTTTDQTVEGELRFKSQFPFSRPISLPPDVRVAQRGAISGGINGDVIDGEWNTTVMTNGRFQLRKYETELESPPDETLSWQEFKEWLERNYDPSNHFLFRGQASSKYRLRTTFHREGRRDLFRYLRNDLPALSNYISAGVGRYYNVDDVADLGVLLNLAQHHGYPTPLLDWTESPYVAAFFAFFDRSPSCGPHESDYVSIFSFDETAYQGNLRVTSHDSIIFPEPALYIVRLPTRDNPRALPQQSVMTLSNVSDIEAHIRLLESVKKTTYLRKFNFLNSERTRALRDLALMGITPATMFPGLDGICKTMKSRHFQSTP